MGNRMAGAFRFLWYAFCPLLIYMFACMIAEVIMYVAGIPVREDLALVTTAAGAVIAVVPLGILYCRSVQRIGISPSFSVFAGVWAVLLGVGACFLFNNLIALTGLDSAAYREVSLLLYRPPLWIQIAATGLLIPVTEELVFRGLGYFRMRWKLSFGWASFVSAIYFGLYHMNIVQGVYAFCLGLLMAYVYETYHSLWASICLHAGANISAVLFNGLIPQTCQERIPLWVMLAASGALMLVGIYKIREDVNKREITFHSDPLL